MRRVWAAVISVWALLALVAVLAWSRPATPVTHLAARTAVVQTAHGTRVVVLSPPAHATTQTSPGAQATVPISGSAPVVSGGAAIGANN
jgi:hypothetical protein